MSHLQESVIKPNGCLALPQLQGGALLPMGGGSGPFPEAVYTELSGFTGANSLS